MMSMHLIVLLCSLLLLVVHGQESGNATYHNPLKLHENTCGPHEGDGGRWIIYVRFYNYCTMTHTEKQNMNKYFVQFRKLALAISKKAKEQYGWNVLFYFHYQHVCSLPRRYRSSIRYGGSYTSGKKFYGLLDVVLPTTTQGSLSASKVARKTGRLIGRLRKHSVYKIAITLAVHDAYTVALKSKLDSDRRYKHDPFFEFNTINGATKVDVNSIVSLMACNPSDIGGVPYRTYNSITNSFDCQCACPGNAPHIVQGTVRSCDRPATIGVSGQCDWLAKCYVVGSSQSRTSSYYRQCRLKDLFGEGLLPSVQTPWDNYVFGKENILTKGAKIKVTTTDPQEQDKQKTYEWLDFQQNGKKLMNNDFYFEQVGVHKLKVEASDYKATSICETEIKIVDTMPPKARRSCPRRSGWVYIADYKHSKMVYNMKRFKRYVASRVNDPCGTDINCDKTKYKLTLTNGEKQFFDTVPTSIKVTQSEFTSHETIASTILKSWPGQTRRKTISFRIRFCEKFAAQSCQATDSTSLIERDSPFKCSMYQSMFLYSSRIHFTRISINAATRVRTKALHDFLKWGYDDSSYRIHEAIPETAVGTDEGEGTYTAFLSEWINIKSVFRNMAKHNNLRFDDLPPGKTINDMVKIRYMINNCDYRQAKVWEHGENKNQVTFTQEDNYIYLEAWSYFGRIRTRTIHVQIHPHAELDTCADFLRTSFYQSIATNQTSDDERYCTFPKSDFAELTIDFNHNVGLEPFDRTKLPFYFQNITCTAYYMQSSASAVEAKKISNGAQLLQYTKENLRFIDRFGIGLKHGTTAPTTPIEFDCHLWYKSQENKIVGQRCKNTITFEDCEAPRFPTETASAGFEKCTKNCPIDAVQPYGYCGDNYLQLIDDASVVADIGEAVFTTASEREDKCCESCGNYQCASLVDTVLNSTLKSCRLLSETDAILLSESEIESQSMIYPGIFLFIAVAAVAAVVKHQTTVREQPDGYAPLL